MSKKDRRKCASCNAKKNVRFYKDKNMFLCDRCGSTRIRNMEVFDSTVTEFEDYDNDTQECNKYRKNKNSFSR